MNKKKIAATIVASGIFWVVNELLGKNEGLSKESTKVLLNSGAEAVYPYNQSQNQLRKSSLRSQANVCWLTLINKILD